jgi:transposase-like protein
MPYSQVEIAEYCRKLGKSRSTLFLWIKQKRAAMARSRYRQPVEKAQQRPWNDWRPLRNGHTQGWRRHYCAVIRFK